MPTGNRTSNRIAADRQAGLLAGSVALEPAQNAPIPVVAVHIRAPQPGWTVGEITAIGATVLAWHPSNETAWLKFDPGFLSFSFGAGVHSN
jgi:hypothetical protein